MAASEQNRAAIALCKRPRTKDNRNTWVFVSKLGNTQNIDSVRGAVGTGGVFGWYTNLTRKSILMFAVSIKLFVG